MTKAFDGSPLFAPAPAPASASAPASVPAEAKNSVKLNGKNTSQPGTTGMDNPLYRNQ